MYLPPRLGWTFLSRDALKQAEAQLAGDTQGVVDELGLMEVHQGYADRFFPGTSVLHTRLRYVLFLAWAYEKLINEPEAQDLEAKIARQERELGKALLKHAGDSWGIIGKRTLPELPSQPPSMIYWSALGTWGLLHKRSNGSIPSRAEIYTRLARGTGPTLVDSEGRALSDRRTPFVSLPPRPKGWPKGKEINFRLTPKEQSFLRERLGSLLDAHTGRPSILSRLAQSRAGTRLSDNDGLLCPAITDVAGKDIDTLRRATHGASISVIVRALYLAMVEQVAVHEGLTERKVCRVNLAQIVERSGESALALDITHLKRDLGSALSPEVQGLLEETQTWLRKNYPRPEPEICSRLVNRYRVQELKRKGPRARLASTHKVRRKEWCLDKARVEEAMPVAIHYRWYVARQLLRDLENQND